jgi:hypothetical protein
MSGRVRLALACGVLAASLGTASADSGSATVGSTRISVGAGLLQVYLPDVRFTQGSDLNGNTVARAENSDLDGRYGFALSGSIALPVRGALWGIDTVVASAHYGRVEGEQHSACGATATTTCTWMNPVDGPGVDKVTSAYGVRASREVHVWGLGLEGRRTIDPARSSYWAAGIDWRALDQDLALTGSGVGGAGFRYGETLDTRYMGALVAFGSDYSLPFLGSLTGGLGLQSSIRVWGGLYYGQADMDGSFSQSGPVVAASRLGRSAESAAFIGGLTTETRKRLTPNAVLSLSSSYTYYSWVPTVAYDNNDGGAPAGTGGGDVGETRLKSDHGFTASTTLRLTIESSAPQPLK